MVDNEIVSIIMPVYNVDGYIAKAIESIIAQTISEWELLIIDDCSTDDSIKIATEYSLKDKRIKIISHKINKGVSEARNTGIRSAIGKYICFVDPDDYCGDTYLEDLLRIKKDNYQLMIGGYVRECNNIVERKLLSLDIATFTADNAILNMIGMKFFDWSPCDKLFLREVLLINKLQFNPDYKLAEDLDFCWRYIRNVNKIGFVPSYQYHYVVHEESVTHIKKTIVRLTSVNVMRKLYTESFQMNGLIRKRMRELYVKEMASCIKDILSEKKYANDIKEMQKIIRRNLIVIKTNSDFGLHIKMAILFFCLPYFVIEEICRWIDFVDVYNKLKKVN